MKDFIRENRKMNAKEYREVKREIADLIKAGEISKAAHTKDFYKDYFKTNHQFYEINHMVLVALEEKWKGETK